MSKHAFWQALIFTAVIFSLGLVLGFFLETKQSTNLFNKLVDSELNVLDEQLRQKIIMNYNISCPVAQQTIFSFADTIYEQAIQLEEADATGRLGDLTILHRRYDLLRALLYTEADSLRTRCGKEFHIVAYFYKYVTEDVSTSSKQSYFSRLVFDLKEKYPDKILLVPIAVDTRVASIDVLTVGLGATNAPVIVVDGNKTITSEAITLTEFEKLVLGK